MIAREATHTVRTNPGHSKDISCDIVRWSLLLTTWLYLNVVLVSCTIESLLEPEAHNDDRVRKAGCQEPGPPLVRDLLLKLIGSQFQCQSVKPQIS